MPLFVEKIRIPVQVLQSGEEPVAGFLSLAPSAQFHDGPETILELLNSARRVIPFQRAADDTTLLLNRTAVSWVAAAPDINTSFISPRNYRVTGEERVGVHFLDGRRIEGTLRMELPEDLNRASDYMNAAEDFFPLLAREGTFLVNKSAVREIAVYSASPRPVNSLGSEDDG